MDMRTQTIKAKCTECSSCGNKTLDLSGAFPCRNLVYGTKCGSMSRKKDNYYCCYSCFTECSEEQTVCKQCGSFFSNVHFCGFCKNKYTSNFTIGSHALKCEVCKKTTCSACQQEVVGNQRVVQFPDRIATICGNKKKGQPDYARPCSNDISFVIYID